MKQTHPISNEKNRELNELALRLPQVPMFITTANGQYALQKTKITSLVSGQAILDKDSKAYIGDQYVQPHLNYIAKNEQVRLMNHKVYLKEAYKIEKEIGVGKYIEYVQQLHADITSTRATVKSEKASWFSKLRRKK